MSVSVQVHRDRGTAHELWSDDRTCAVAVARQAGSVVGSLAVLDLGADDPDLRFVGVAEGSAEARVPLVEAAASVVRDAGGRTLRWVEETGELSLTAAAALERLGATAGDEVHRWWRRELPTAPEPAPDSRGRKSSAAGGAPFRVSMGDAWCDVEVDGDRAVLVHDRQEEGTADALAALMSLALRRVTTESPGIRAAETCLAPGDDTFETALLSLGFAPTTRRAVEYHLTPDT
ncbi:hypothetical protein K2224_31290 (plasmid) [Streptomyces sp. BHT-5-2]|uniref:hypothetical protein n=1 Tax=unclassified Streptomyces TaxID=2593676 RepID=UPI001C8EFC3D|nr:hypothetical protein [Streptomyces sp. BHT-5-2]QZL07720.1 hypothetical protein K2224_31290 [Streptomyces sp. BHT-5-2]